ncbi:LysE family transporter [Streptomyces tuirus]|uniref:LysE family transporter n=1 Tax=Streptomyces tuirus TaxID=68278 RepID=A0A941FL44_9ACTN|nr:LysE family transporter [Streptomyces tuirus]
MQWHQVLGFVAAVTPLTLIPGTSFTLVTQQVMAGSRSDGALVALGSACGLLVHATFAAVGLSALVMSSAQALTLVKLLGGNVLNPKAASAYLTLVPFLTPDRPIAPQVAALAVVHAAVVIAWLLFCTSVIAAARAAVDTPRFRRGMTRLAGAVLVAFGIRTAIAR